MADWICNHPTLTGALAGALAGALVGVLLIIAYEVMRRDQ